MRRKIILILTLLLISDDVFGINRNKTKQMKTVHKNNNSKICKVNDVRIKRSLDDGIEKIFAKENIIDGSKQYDYLEGRGRDLKLKSAFEKESPFWGSRGRRDSSSDETVLLNLEDKLNKEVPPFWSNRERRDADESKEDDMPQDQFWATRGRRQDEDPFWGTRGRRQEEESPFWGNRGRRGSIVSPNRSSKEEFENDEPFWGNRGRREEEEPFWGNRGRREQFEPYSEYGKSKAKTLYSFKNVLNQKNLKDSIINAIDDLRTNNNNIDRNRREDLQAPFWMNRGRNSKIRNLFNGLARSRMQYDPNTSNKLLANELYSKSFQQNTLHDDRIYADEPHYILVERSSRSSAEDDPFFISRGKKYSKSNLAKAVRGRRGALEDIMKSVRNDPYNIARGKKDYIQIGKSNTTERQLNKIRDHICASIDLLAMKHSEGNKVKREVLDNDRDRRTTLKKLALQLQTDPYFVSRGKKDGENNIYMDDVEQLINNLILLCN